MTVIIVLAIWSVVSLGVGQLIGLFIKEGQGSASHDEEVRRG